MATIGLKVQDSPIGGDLSLANMLAKSIFGDPEGQINARVKASQVGAHEAYREKQLADAGLVGVKTKEEQDILDAERRAGPAVGEAAALAVPQPVPVEVSRASVPEDTRYGPQIVDQSKLDADTARYNALVEQQRALGRLLVHGNPEQVAKGVNTNYGGAILAGATANPAIVNPDSLRLASTLYTGSAPTTSTVMTSGDYAGVDAAARGKILEERAKPPPITDYRGQPGIVRTDAQGNPVYVPAQGTAPDPIKPNVSDVNGVQVETTIDPATGKAVSAPVPGAPVKPPEIKTVESGGVQLQLIVDPQTGREHAYVIPGQPPTTQKPNTFTGANGETLLAVPDANAPGGYRAVPMTDAPAPLPHTVAVDPSKPLMTQDAGGLHPLAGMPAAPVPSASIYDQGLTPVAADNKFVGETAMKIYAGQPVNRDQALQYAQSWNNLYAAKYQIEIINGQRSLIPVEPEKPSPYPKPEIVLSKAGVDQAIIDAATKPVVVESPTPVQTGGNAPVQTAGGPAPAPAVTSTGPKIIPLEKPKLTPLTTEQEKAQSYLAMGHEANAILSKLTPKTIPSGWEIGNAQYASKPGLTSSIVGWATSNAAKKYNGSAKAFIEAYARPATGATISPADYENFYGAMIPLPTDPQSEFDRKARLRADLEEVWLNGSGFPDEASRDAWFAKHGVARANASSSAPVEKPPASYPGSPESWKHLTPEEKKLF